MSKSTASRVLTGSPNVSPDARRRIREAVDRLGYRTNLSARSLRTERTAQVGLLVPAINNEVFGEIAERLDEVLRESDVSLAVTSSGWQVAGDSRALDELAARGVDAIVVSLVDDRDRGVADRLRNLDVPLILLDREVRGLACDRVLADHGKGIEEAISHLAKLGHRRIGMFSPTERTRPGRAHIGAYLASVERLGLDRDDQLTIHLDHFERTDGANACKQLLDAGATGILSCTPVASTAGMLDAIAAAGLSIPRNVSFIEYTDSDLATIYRPELSVVLRPVNEMGRLAGRMALSRMSSPDARPRDEMVETSFMDRKSTARPPDNA